MITNIFFGVAIFQIIFITYQYILLKRTEFVYYILYSILITLFIAGNVVGNFIPFKLLKCDGSDFSIGRGLLTMGFGMYFLFGQKFTEVETLRPSFSRQLKYVYCSLFLIGIIDLGYMILGGSYRKSDVIIRWVHFFLIIYGIYVIVFLMFLKNVLTTILVIGSSFLVAGCCFGTIDTIFISKRLLAPSEYFPYLEGGIIGEFLCLTYGLIYKTRTIEAENLRLIHEENQKVLKERERIYQDLHDDLGAGISSVKILSEMIANNSIPMEKTKLYSARMHRNIEEVSHQLQNFVWAIDESHSGIYEFIEYIRNYVHQYFVNGEMEVFISSEILNNKMKMDSLVRKNLFLCIKEILNNAVKYSNGTRMDISLSNTEFGLLRISLRDNGVGIDTSKVRGNGLNNIRKRMREINGIQNLISDNTGTEFVLEWTE